MSKQRKFKGYEKDRVYESYNGCCAYCGEPVARDDMTISHKQPLSKGGTNGMDNLMLSCWTCNHMRADLGLEEFVERLKRVIQHIEEG